MNSFYSEKELRAIGFAHIGKNVLISKLCSIYSPKEISIGDNVRIDDFCVLSGEITIGNNVHVSAGSKLFGKNGIEFEDYTGCSSNSIIYSATDDFSGDYMIGPMAPDGTTNVTGGKVILRKFSQLGANTIVMPGLEVGEGAVTGALTFVNKNLEPWTINVGIPCRVLRSRSMKIAGGGVYS